MNVVSEIFPDTLWQPDSAFSHIYAMTYYNPAFFCIQWPQPFRHFTWFPLTLSYTKSAYDNVHL